MHKKFSWWTLAVFSLKLLKPNSSQEDGIYRDDIPSIKNYVVCSIPWTSNDGSSFSYIYIAKKNKKTSNTSSTQSLTSLNDSRLNFKIHNTFDTLSLYHASALCVCVCMFFCYSLFDWSFGIVYYLPFIVNRRRVTI